MTNTPSDDVLFELIKEHFDLDKRPFDTVIDLKTGRFQDAARYRDFASAVLARWGTPQPVVREPLTANQVSGLAESAGYWHGDMSRADFINGIRYAEAAHGITKKRGQHGTE